MAGPLSAIGPVTGVDGSAEMIVQAKGYAALERADIADWTPSVPPALIFSNAVLHWLPDHGSLMPHLARALAPGGVLAVQMPRQETAPSHRFLRDIAARMFPDRFATEAPSRVRPAADYADLLAPLGHVEAWETEYVQMLEAVEGGHPVRHFTQGAAMLPFLSRMTQDESARFIAAYDAALAAAYPLRTNGGVLFPFRRCFFVLRRD